jgi:hypothetical protein
LRRTAPAIALAVLLSPVLCAAGGEALAPPDLPAEHHLPGGHVTFRTPADWTVTDEGHGRVDAWGPEIGMRIVERDGEQGLDGFHVDCMEQRLAAPMDMDPQVQYEYDHVGGMVGEQRGLDSAFAVVYDKEVRGHRMWRQRNISLVGLGRSLCVVGYVPAALWKKKKSNPVRLLMDAVLSSVTVR